MREEKGARESTFGPRIPAFTVSLVFGECERSVSGCG